MNTKAESRNSIKSRIDSYDIEDLLELLHEPNELIDETAFDEQVKWLGNKTEKEIELLKAKLAVIKPVVRAGHFFDWKEEHFMLLYLAKMKLKYPQETKFCYNAYVGGDGWRVIFSEIELPKCEELYEGYNKEVHTEVDLTAYVDNCYELLRAEFER